MNEFICDSCFQPLQEGTPVCPHCGYDPRTTEGKYPLALVPGSILNGRYEIGRVLGQGGFGITYAARDYRTKARVAIKEFFPDTMATRSDKCTVRAFTGEREEHFGYGLECFLSEAQTLAQFIGNPSIVGVSSYFEENGTAYFVMEYIEGVSLQDYVTQQGGRLNWEQTKACLYPVMDALEAVHARGIIHRDVTPDNIVITKDGGVKLLDFGAARYSLGDRSRSLDVILKHGYAPIEQYTRRGKQGPYTDIYALAASFYYSLTGRVPPEAIDRMNAQDLILPSAMGSDIPAGAELALEKALAVQHPDRYQTMEEFREGLESETPVADVYDDGPVLWDPPEDKKQEKEKGEEPKKGIVWEKPDPSKKKGGLKKWALVGVAAAAVAVAALVFTPQKEEAPTVRVPTIETQAPTEPRISYSGQTVDTSKLPSFLKKPERNMPGNKTVALGYNFTAALYEDGSVITFGQFTEDIGHWKDIQVLAAGMNHLVGLRSDGTVVSDGYNIDGECDVDGWSNIVDIAVSMDHSVGLKSDGTVVAVGLNEDGQCNVSGWSNVVDIQVGDTHTVGLCADGRVLAVGKNDRGQCNVSGWTDIEKIAVGDYVTVGLKSDGTVVYTYESGAESKVSGWTDVVEIAANMFYAYGLRADGTVVGTCFDSTLKNWSNVTHIDAGSSMLVGLKADGTLLMADFTLTQEDVSSWRNVKAVWADWYHVVAMTEDGTVLAAGGNDQGECNIAGMGGFKKPF